MCASNKTRRDEAGEAAAIPVLQVYKYGRITPMKTLNMDYELFEQAKAACGAATNTEAVRLALDALVRHAV